jgi:acyl-coenzyme A synthetase/AMP-(fatty) acid ligase
VEAGLVEGAVVGLSAARAIDVAVALGAAAEVDARLLLLDASAPEAEAKRILDGVRAEALLSASGARFAIRPLGGDPATRAEGGGLLLRTSGVTGEPKVAQRPWRAVLRNAEAFAQTLSLGPSDVVVSTSPLHYSYAVNAGMLSALAAGATFNSPALPATPARLSEALSHTGGSVVMSVPALWRWYASSGELRPRLAISAGEALPTDVRAAWLDGHEQPLCEHYGTTELGQLSVDLDGVPGSVGHALPGIAFDVAQANGSGPGRVMARDLDAGTAPIDTGDVGRLAADGRLRLEGRACERVKVNGATIPLRDVEAVIAELAGVSACACTVRDVGVGQQLWAFLEMDGALDQAALRQRLLDELAPHEIPTVMQPMERLPRTPSGKLARGALAER